MDVSQELYLLALRRGWNRLVWVLVVGKWVWYRGTSRSNMRCESVSLGLYLPLAVGLSPCTLLRDFSWTVLLFFAGAFWVAQYHPKDEPGSFWALIPGCLLAFVALVREVCRVVSPRSTWVQTGSWFVLAVLFAFSMVRTYMVTPWLILGGLVAFFPYLIPWSERELNSLGLRILRHSQVDEGRMRILDACEENGYLSALYVQNRQTYESKATPPTASGIVTLQDVGGATPATSIPGGRSLPQPHPQTLSQTTRVPNRVEKPALVLVHDVYMGATMWTWCLRALSETYDVYCVELRDCGRSDRFRRSDYMDDDLNSWLTHHLPSLPYVLVGHGLGATVVARWFEGHQDDLYCKKILLLNPAGAPSSEDLEVSALERIQHRAGMLTLETLARFYGPLGKQVVRAFVVDKWTPGCPHQSYWRGLTDDVHLLFADYMYHNMMVHGSGGGARLSARWLVDTLGRDHDAREVLPIERTHVLVGASKADLGQKWRDKLFPVDIAPHSDWYLSLDCPTELCEWILSKVNPA